MTHHLDEAITRLADWLAASRTAVFFGGAGVSTESGIPDFRSAAGLYARRSGAGRPPEYLLSAECLHDEPAEFFAFHRANLVHPDAHPNPAHVALASLEASGHLAAVVTQNIDGLHQAAGSRVVHELHGSLQRNYCLGPISHRFSLAEIPDAPVVPVCPQCGAMVRPEVVLYGEGLDPEVLDAAIAALEAADLLIVGGTSLNVYPAAGLLNHCRGDRLVLINLEPTPWDRHADLAISARVGEVLQAAVDQL